MAAAVDQLAADAATTSCPSQSDMRSIQRRARRREAAEVAVALDQDDVGAQPPAATAAAVPAGPPPTTSTSHVPYTGVDHSRLVDEGVGLDPHGTPTPAELSALLPSSLPWRSRLRNASLACGVSVARHHPHNSGPPLRVIDKGTTYLGTCAHARPMGAVPGVQSGAARVTPTSRGTLTWVIDWLADGDAAGLCYPQRSPSSLVAAACGDDDDDDAATEETAEATGETTEATTAPTEAATTAPVEETTAPTTEAPADPPRPTGRSRARSPTSPPTSADRARPTTASSRSRSATSTSRAARSRSATRTSTASTTRSSTSTRRPAASAATRSRS